MRTDLPLDEVESRVARCARHGYHIGLLHDVWTRLRDGRVPHEWLAGLARWSPPNEYVAAYRTWVAALDRLGSRMAIGTLAARMLVGHGEASPTEVGITVHRTWGAPVIPGSALKGLLSHWVDAVLGPADGQRHPLNAAGADEDTQSRLPYRGPLWKGGRAMNAPGVTYRRMFGSPDADTDGDYLQSRPSDVGRARGMVIFHDALMVPFHPNVAGSTFAVDVLTPHHTLVAGASSPAWPNDWEDPTPVGFLSVRPGTSFLIAMGGDPELAPPALELLKEALEGWGIGGKTTSGYGRFARDAWRAERSEERAGPGD